jgi:hypothetical protein
MKTFIVLGADRVGKSTAIKKWQGQATEQLKVWHSLHFSGISPQDHSPIDQFLNPVRGLPCEGMDYLFCDRFVQDMIFYEDYRRQMGFFDDEFVKIVDSAYRGISRDGMIYIVLKNSDKDILIQRHRAELISENPQASSWWVDRNVDIRMRENDAYYYSLKNNLPRTGVYELDTIKESIPDLFDITCWEW